MLGRKFAAAHFAALDGRSLARKLAQRCERAVLLRVGSAEACQSPLRWGTRAETVRPCSGHLRVARPTQIPKLSALRYRLSCTRIEVASGAASWIAASRVDFTIAAVEPQPRLDVQPQRYGAVLADRNQLRH